VPSISNKSENGKKTKSEIIGGCEKNFVLENTGRKLKELKYMRGVL
jgi:hypothetical protein